MPVSDRLFSRKSNHPKKCDEVKFAVFLLCANVYLTIYYKIDCGSVHATENPIHRLQVRTRQPSRTHMSRAIRKAKCNYAQINHNHFLTQSQGIQAITDCDDGDASLSGALNDFYAWFKA